HELSGRRLPRDAGARRRSRAAQVGDVVSRQPGPRPPDRGGPRARLERGGGRAPGDAGGRRGGWAPGRGRGEGRGGAAAGAGRPAGTGRGVGAGVNGRAAACTFVARGRTVSIWDVDAGRAESVASELGCAVAASREEALGADLVVTVTPGHEVLFEEGSLRAGQHVSLMGADGPGEAEIAPAELARAHVFCDDWEQASHSGDISHAVEAGLIARDGVTQLGAVLAGDAPGRAGAVDVTVFDSTGLAIQDLAIAIVAIDCAGELGVQTLAI